MSTQDKLSALLSKEQKTTLCKALKISRPTLDKYLKGDNHPKHEIAMRIDFLYAKSFGLNNPSTEELMQQEQEIRSQQYLIDPRQEFVFKDYVKKIAFGSYEIEADDVADEEVFRGIANGKEIEKDISRKAFLEMNNLYALSYKMLTDAALGKRITINQESVKQWHYALMQGVRSDAGEYSNKMRIIEGSEIETTPPSAIPSAMQRWVERCANIKTLRDIAFSHEEFEKIHPFGDGNGRIGRLILAVQCIGAGFVPPLINHTNASLYYASLEAAQSGKKLNTFAAFLIQAIQVTTASMSLLPKGMEEARKTMSEGMVSYGFNAGFLEKGICVNQDLLDAFATASKRLSLQETMAHPKTKHELILEFAYGSSRIEGSTFNKLDTQKFLEYGFFPDYKYDDDKPEQKEIDKQMAINNKRVMEFVLNFEQELLVETIIAVHDMIVNDIRWHGAKGITNDTRSVLTNEGRYIPPVGKSKIESMLKGVLERSHTIENPYAKAIFLQLAIAHIQPFEDGNKRTARAIGGIPLIQSGITPFSYDGVNKERYIDAICRYYEYGDSVDKFGGVILNAYESQIETLVACLQEKIADA